MTRFATAVGLSALLLSGCHVIFGLDEFTEAKPDDDGTEPRTDAGSMVEDASPGSSAPALDDDASSAGSTPPADASVAGGGGSMATGPSTAGGGSGGGSSVAQGGGGTNGGTNGAPDAGPLAQAGSAGSLAVDAGGRALVDAGDGGASVCMPGARDCEAGLPRECDADGSWLNLGPCEEGVCFDGRCVPPSCAGLPRTCGPTGDEDCCASPTVTGGTFERQHDPTLTVTLSEYRLDRFEVTVGRFRKFLQARDSWEPAVGDGAYPRVPGSGWNAAWPLGTAAEIEASLVDCDLSSYTAMSSGRENRPIECLNWYEAFAFCAWDGGYLATDSQWSYAAMAGAEQRYYPWSIPATSTVLDSTLANYSCPQPVFSPDCLLDVGRLPAGDGAFGHADLAGNAIEWVMDADDAGTFFDCRSGVNCLSLVGSERGLRGGSYKGGVANDNYNTAAPSDRLTFFLGEAPGMRCAREPVNPAAPESCTPDEAGCDADVARQCDASGQWVDIETCEDGCQSGSCNECSGSELGCIDNVPTTCDGSGKWVRGAACAGATPVCRDGTCVPRCTGLDGCGPAADQDCCEALPVPGGAFERLNDSSLPADVSPFDLERFEVTVGRLREFVDAYPSSRPSVGAGAHPFTPGSGWDAAWDANLPATRSDLVEGLRSCQRNLDIDISTYTEKPGVNDSRPVNCVTWYEAFAFCAWTGGRLPTFAEHQFAYVGGSAQRYFPWSVPPSDTTIDFSRANFLEQSCPSDTTDESSCVAPVGSSPAGAGAFGQEDLAGNLSEFTLDPSALPLSSSCNDCIETSATSTSRRISGGSWLDDAYELQGDYGYGGALPTDRSSTIGFRCVQP